MKLAEKCHGVEVTAKTSAYVPSIELSRSLLKYCFQTEVQVSLLTCLHIDLYLYFGLTFCDAAFQMIADLQPGDSESRDPSGCSECHHSS